MCPRTSKGSWPFSASDPFPNADVYLLYGTQHVKGLYLKARSEYKGR